MTRATTLRRAAVAATIASSILVLVVACRVAPLQVGTENAAQVVDAEAEAAPADAGTDTRTLTREESLKERCAEEAGPNNPFFSALELTQRIVGRFYLCDPPNRSLLQDGDGDGFQFAPDGTWAVLYWNDTRTDFVADNGDAYNHGRVRYHAFVDPDAGSAADAGIVSRDVDRDDPTTRTGLVVYLDRRGGGIGPDPHAFTFSRAPRQMEVVEYGPSPLRARYVPID